MRWGVEKRLEFIEFRLYWEGGINRADIIRQFGVSVPQASKDLALYETSAPGNLRYDKRAKRYRIANDFKPVFLEPNAAMYLSHLRTTVGSGDEPSGAWLAVVPDFDAMPVPQRRINAALLRDVLSAIRAHRSIELHYQSMSESRPLPEWRRLTPHALANDGMRWHVRGFCHIDRKFKDFILSRCLETRKPDTPGSVPQDDRMWRERFTVVLAPNPALSHSQQRVIAHDYEMEKGLARVSVRKALLYYFQKRLRLDVADRLDHPNETPVVVVNRDAFNAALAEAMG